MVWRRPEPPLPRALLVVVGVRCCPSCWRRLTPPMSLVVAGEVMGLVLRPRTTAPALAAVAAEEDDLSLSPPAAPTPRDDAALLLLPRGGSRWYGR